MPFYGSTDLDHFWWFQESHSLMMYNYICSTVQHLSAFMCSTFCSVCWLIFCLLSTANDDSLCFSSSSSSVFLSDSSGYYPLCIIDELMRWSEHISNWFKCSINLQLVSFVIRSIAKGYLPEMMEIFLKRFIFHKFEGERNEKNWFNCPITQWCTVSNHFLLCTALLG